MLKLTLFIIFFTMLLLLVGFEAATIVALAILVSNTTKMIK